MALKDDLYDVFGPGDADPGLPFSEYVPDFGEEQLFAVQAARPRITGNLPVALGPAGAYGRLFADLGRRQAAQGVASGDLLSGASGTRQRAMSAAQTRRQREQRAADTATRQQQARTRANIAAAVGEGIESTRDALENPMIQQAIKGHQERMVADSKNLEASLAPQREAIETTLSEMRATAEGPFKGLLERPRYSLRPQGESLGATELLLSGVPGLDWNQARRVRRAVDAPTSLGDTAEYMRLFEELAPRSGGEYLKYLRGK